MRDKPLLFPGRPGLRAVVAASVVATAGVFPVFLLSAVAVLVRTDLGFTEAQLGLTVSIFFAVGALASVPGGTVVERLGGRGALLVGAGGVGVALLGMATALSWEVLLAWVVVGGVANLIAQLGANLRLAGSVSPGRQGFAFGIKQSANPLATLAGGLAVPMIGLTLGWRWVFVLGSLVALTAGLVQSRRPAGPRPRLQRRRERTKVTLARRPLILLGVAVTFGAASVTAMAAFVVEYAVTVGIEPGTAGLVLAVGSLAAVTVRMGMGWRADRRHGGTLKTVTAMLVAGGVAFAAFPLVSTWLPLTAVTVLAYALGWGWPGLFNLVVVRGNPEAPAAATGITQVGAYGGGVVGPLTFGLLVGEFGYAIAWWTATGWLFAGAALMLVGRSAARRAWVPERASTAGGSGR